MFDFLKVSQIKFAPKQFLSCKQGSIMIYGGVGSLTECLKAKHWNALSCNKYPQYQFKTKPQRDLCGGFSIMLREEDSSVC